jgi:conjugal transfer pilus assembly protein TraF
MSLNVLLIESKGVKRKGTEVPGNSYNYYAGEISAFVPWLAIVSSATCSVPEVSIFQTITPIDRGRSTRPAYSRGGEIKAEAPRIEEVSPIWYGKTTAAASNTPAPSIQYNAFLPFLFSSLSGSFCGVTEIILLCSLRSCSTTSSIRGRQYPRHSIVYSVTSFTSNSFIFALRKAALVIRPPSQCVGKISPSILMKATFSRFIPFVYVGMGALPKESEQFVLSQFFISVVIEEICPSVRVISVPNFTNLICITIFYPYINFYAAILLHEAKIHKNKVIYLNKLDEDSTFALRSRPGIRLCGYLKRGLERLKSLVFSAHNAIKRILRQGALLCSSLLLFAVAGNSLASAGFYDGSKEGWYWFEQQQLELKVHEPGDELKDILSSSQDASQKLAAIRNLAAKQLDQAIMLPTAANIKNYRITQDYVSAQASTFSKNWQLVNHFNPEFDASLQHPYNHSAIRVKREQDEKLKRKRIEDLAQHYGLVFFFKAGCPYCHKYASFVKDFAERFGFAVQAVSLDGGTLPEFPNPIIDQGLAARLQVKAVPALIAANPGAEQFFPLAYGFVAEEEILERMQMLFGGKA